MQELPFVTVLVLNYNSLRDLPDNLQSLQQLDYPEDRHELLLVDNDSEDSSLSWVREHYPQVRIVKTGGNLGYAGGNNAGVRAAQGEWVAILNPDTRVQPDWLRALVRPALGGSNVASVASRMLAWQGDTLDFGDAAINFMGWGCQPGYGTLRLDDYLAEKPLIFACGGAMLVHRDRFLDAGGFDEDYFAYFEDVDLGWRLWLLGHQVTYAPQAIVFHRHHGAWEEVANAKRWLLAERNTLFTIVKNYSAEYLGLILPAALLLLFQRAYLDVSPDPALYGGVPASVAQPFGGRYYLAQTAQLLRRRQFADLGKRAGDELGRRWRRRGQTAGVAVQSVARRPVDGVFQVPPLPAARLLAGRQVWQSWDRLLAKRAGVQARRQRADEEIFPLFQWALRSNFGDSRFIQAMAHVAHRFGLESVFTAAAAVEWERNPGEVEAIASLSQAVVAKLLSFMDHAFSISTAPEEWFLVGGAPPPEIMALPEEAVALLARMNQILWSLPERPPLALLRWLEKEIPC
jgi:GT2 family glycosyltransferase